MTRLRNPHTSSRKNTQNDNNKRYENCHNLRDTNAQLSLTSHPPSSNHISTRRTPSQSRQHETTRQEPSPGLVVRAPTSAPQSVLLLHCAIGLVASRLVFNPGSVSWPFSASFETSYALQKSLDTLIADFRRQPCTFLS